MKRNILLGVFLALAALGGTALAQPKVMDTLTFHGDRQRLGWNSKETALTPSSVAGGAFGPRWNSPRFDSVTVAGTTYAPHLYASPLYVDTVPLSAGGRSFADCPQIPPGKTFAGSIVARVVFAATSNGLVYAVNAFSTIGSSSIPAGTILWCKRLGTPAANRNLDKVPLGVLSTPIIDLTTTTPRLYVASADASAGWRVFALDITSGKLVPGWPVAIKDAVVSPVNQNGPAKFQATSAMSQRSALNLSPDGKLLYVSFGGYMDLSAGWMVAIDTGLNASNPHVESAFSGAPSVVGIANGGMWASGGPAIDASGNVYSTTGNSCLVTHSADCPNLPNDMPGFWGQSLLVWAPQLPLTLVGTYSPYNYCKTDLKDIDLAGSAPVVLPDLGAATSTPHLVTFGSKQGIVYLIDRDLLPGSLEQRPACNPSALPDPRLDTSLLPPGGGPLSVFKPNTDDFGASDFAKMRTTPAYFSGPDGTSFLVVSGASKAAANSTTSVPPSLARLRIITMPGVPAYLSIDKTEGTRAFLSPGSPVVTSNGSNSAIIWVLVANLTRTTALRGSNVPHPILYAFDAGTLTPLWHTSAPQLNVGGKYNTPTVARGVVFVGTDRIQAFGLGASPAAVISINAGGGAAGTFVADTDVVGGRSNQVASAVATTGVADPGPQAVYQSKRTGSSGVGFIYTIPNFTPGASYLVRLHFADGVSMIAGQRRFNVAINGTKVLANFDIFQAAGGRLKAVVEPFATTANGAGQIVIQYTYGTAGNPLASGIEVLKMPVAAP